MKVFYDKEHDACMVLFEKSDCVFIYQTDEGLEIHSCKGGKPEIIERQLLFGLEEKGSR